MNKLFLFLIATLVLIAPFQAFAEGEEKHFIVNSRDWHDVYSGGIFSALMNYDYHYAIEETQSLEILQILDRNINDVILLTPEGNSFISGYRTSIQTQGFNIEQEITNSDFVDNNLELARLSGVDSFVLVDDTYGYNAISVGPYAVRTNSFVIFVNENNVDDVIDVIDGASSVLAYGPLDLSARDALTPYITETINERSKYKNNVKILDKISEIEPIELVALTNGNILEPELIDGNKPIIFIGTDVVPDGTTEFIEEKNVRVGVLIGEGLHFNARQIREDTGIEVYIKFAKGINQVKKALDIMFVNQYNLNVNVNDAIYDQENGQIQVRIVNQEDNFAYALISVQIVQDGEVIAILGDESIDFLSGQETLTKLFDFELDPNGNYTINTIIRYGEDEFSLERELETDTPLNIVNFDDNSLIEILEVTYDKDSNRFNILVENKRDQNVFALSKITGLSIGTELNNLASKETEIGPLGTRTIRILAELDEEDFLDNPTVDISTFYGKESKRLVRVINSDYQYTFENSLDSLIPVAIGAGVVALTALVIVLTKSLIFGSRKTHKVTSRRPKIRRRR